MAFHLWRGPAPLLLASTSHIRRRVLEAAGIPVEVEAADLDERAIEGRLGPMPAAAIAEQLALRKARAVAGRHPGRIVLGADQVLERDGATMAKPVDRAQAAGQIAELAGRTHHLHSAVAILGEGRGETVFSVRASLTMRPMDEAAIAAYLDCAGEAAQGSAGGYQIEALGIHLFERIEGEHSTILGLPLLPVLAWLRGAGLIAI